MTDACSSSSSSLNTPSSSQCGICFVQPHCTPVTMACLHVFCKDCAQSSLKLSPLCPLCNKKAEPLQENCTILQDSLADINLKIEELKLKRERFLVSKEREIKKMALEFLVESKNQKLEKIRKLKSELTVVRSEITAFIDPELKRTSCSSDVDDEPSKKKVKSDQLDIIPLENLTDNYANILKNFSDLENHFFSTSRKHSKIGKLIYDAFKYDSVSVLGSFAVNGSDLSPSYIHDLAVSQTGLLSVAGSLDTVNLYNYKMIEDNPLPLLYPVSKLATLSPSWTTSWNPCSHNLLAVAQSTADIKLWDVTAGVPTISFQGHNATKYLTVEFTPTKPHQLVSAGFDADIKVWRLNERGSVLNIRAPDKLFTLCCRPMSPFHLAVSSVDRMIYLYDLRKPEKAVSSLAGHSKSVFQLSYLDSKTLISASVDGTLKQWNQETGQCERTYHGHSNTNSFIGLDTMSEEYILCGSENNSLVMYHEALSRPVASHQFPSSTSILGRDTQDVNERHIGAIAAGDQGLCCVGNDIGLIHVVKFRENSVLRNHQEETD